MFKNNIKTLTSLSNRYLTGTSSVTALNINDSSQIQTPTLTNPANILFISLFRSLQEFPNTNNSTNASSLKILGPNPIKGNISALVSDPSTLIGKISIIQLNYTDWNIATIGYSQPYSIMPVSTAWQDVKSQNSYAKLVYIAPKGSDPLFSLQEVKVSTFDVQNISLAYYDDTNSQKYIQPIYVFNGVATLSNGILADFYFYVPAIQ